MQSPAITTVTRILELLPETAQEQVAQHLREYIEDLQDELQWDNAMEKTQEQLASAGLRAKEEIRRGLATPLDYDQL